MIRMKELREATGQTQSDVATKLAVSQQTYARWEGGKSEPSLAKLRDLASIFATTIDYLLGRTSAPPPSTRLHHLADGSDGFYGHLGLRLPNTFYTRWYPVTEGEASKARKSLSSGFGVTDWVLTETLNNRVLAFRPDQMQRIWLLDETCDGPDDDFMPVTPFHIEPLSIETYKAMAEWVDNGDAQSGDFNCNNSEDFRKEVKSKIERAGFMDKPSELYKFLHYTNFYFTDGQCFGFRALHSSLLHTISAIEEPDERRVSLEASGGDFECFYSKEMLRLVEFPLIELTAASENFDV